MLFTSKYRFSTVLYLYLCFVLFFFSTILTWQQFLFDLRWYECNVLKFLFVFISCGGGNCSRKWKERETETLFLSKYDSSFLRATDVWGCVCVGLCYFYTVIVFFSSRFILCLLYVCSCSICTGALFFTSFTIVLVFIYYLYPAVVILVVIG